MEQTIKSMEKTYNKYEKYQKSIEKQYFHLLFNKNNVKHKENHGSVAHMDPMGQPPSSPLLLIEFSNSQGLFGGWHGAPIVPYIL